MMKAGVAVVLAIASLTFAAARPACSFQHCVGPEPGDNGPCCPGTRCVMKNAHYAQCLPNDMPIPALWLNGQVIPDKTPVDTPVEVPVVPPPEEDIPDEDIPDEDIPDEDEPDEDEPDEDISEEAPSPGDADDEAFAPESIPEDDTTLPEDDPEVVDPEQEDEEIPDELLDITYQPFPGRDFTPAQATASSVIVKDLENGSWNVSSTQECEDLCTVSPGCNAASYYLDAEVYKGKNCWLKTLEPACGLPDKATFDDNAVFFIQINETCTDLALAPEEALGPVADTPIRGPAVAPVAAVPRSTPPTPTPRLSANTPTTPTAATPGEKTSGAATYTTALVAVAVAGAVALF